MGDGKGGTTNDNCSFRKITIFLKLCNWFQSWRNNLVFHGIPPDPSGCEEEDSGQTEDKVREVIRIDLQISRYVLGLRYCEISHFICEVYICTTLNCFCRDIPILRAQRIRSGPQIKGTQPILGKTWLHSALLLKFNYVLFRKNWEILLYCFFSVVPTLWGQRGHFASVEADPRVQWRNYRNSRGSCHGNAGKQYNSRSHGLNWFFDHCQP